MHAFATIDLAQLVTVTGGDGTQTTPPQNTEKFELEGTIGAKIKGAPVGLNGKLSTETSLDTPSQCAKQMTNPRDKLACYRMFAPQPAQK